MNNDVSINIKQAIKREMAKMMILGCWFAFGLVLFTIEFIQTGKVESLIFYSTFPGIGFLFIYFDCSQRFYMAIEQNDNSTADAMKFVGEITEVLLMFLASLQLMLIILTVGKF